MMKDVYDSAYGKVTKWDAFQFVWQAAGYLDVSELPSDKRIADGLRRAGAYITALCLDE